MHSANDIVRISESGGMSSDGESLFEDKLEAVSAGECVTAVCACVLCLGLLLATLTGARVRLFFLST